MILQKLVSKGYEYKEPLYDENDVKIAIVGRPNVGKSSIINAMTGENRVLVANMPGTTRDSIDTIIDHHGQRLILIDTAGIRRSGKIGSGNIENWSVMRSERAIERADIVVIVMDADE